MRLIVLALLLLPAIASADTELRYSKNVERVLDLASKECLEYGLNRMKREFKAAKSEILPAEDKNYSAWRKQRFSDHYKSCLKEIAEQMLQVVPSLKAE